MIKMTVQANLGGLQKFADGLDAALDDAADESAQAIAEGAAANSAPFHRTGSETAGYYVLTPRRDIYDQAVSRASSLNPRVEIVPKANQPRRGGAAVGNVTGHFPVNELGSPARNRPARAMLRRAVEAERPNYPGRVQRRVRRLAGG